MSKNITTKITIQNLATELKKKFGATNSRLSAVENSVASAFKSGKVTGNKVELFTSADKSGAAAFSFDFPAELFLDQAKTEFVGNFTFSQETYPGATDPNLNGKPVMVLAVKGDDTTTYSFLDMAALVDTYAAKTEGKDASTTITISGYEVEVKVNISAQEGNQLQLKPDGLYVPAPAAVDVSGKADKVVGATEGHLAALDADGNPTDSGVEASKVITEADITDYTAEEIEALLTDAPSQA